MGKNKPARTALNQITRRQAIGISHERNESFTMRDESIRVKAIYNPTRKEIKLIVVSRNTYAGPGFVQSGAPTLPDRLLKPERLKKNCSHSERGFLGFWRGFGEGAGLKNPVTEPKRRQNPKRPLFLQPFRMATVFLKML